MELTIENHPWEIYPKRAFIEKLIVGSFPPNKMVFAEGVEIKYLDGVNKINKRHNKRFDFFYGSKNNGFWELFITSLNLVIDPDDIMGLKKWLKLNKWGVTDIILTTTRKKDSPSDTDLVPKVWNTDIIEKTIKNNKIQSIYFTSKWVRNHFERIINPKLYKSTNLFTLISPSPSGLRRFPKEALLELPKSDNESNQEYRLRYYNYVLSIQQN